MDGFAETLIDLDAVSANVAALRQHVGGPRVPCRGRTRRT